MLAKLLVAFSLCLAVIHATLFNETATPLKAYKISDITVSGLSAGGFMAVQMHVTYSSIIDGAGIFAGSNLMNAEYKCMDIYMGLPNVAELVDLTRRDETLGLIDKVSNMRGDKVYLFSGSSDSVVNPKVMEVLQDYYQNFVDVSDIVADYSVPAQHCIPTLSYGENCGQLASPYIGKCNFDGAGIAFGAMYGSLNPSTNSVASSLTKFTQTSYIPSGWTAKSASVGDTGYIYVPAACAAGATCRLHVSFHGCSQTLDDIDNAYAAHGGFNEWAEANNIIVLYPYAVKSLSMPSNPNGCWDWWSYTDRNYGNNQGAQMQMVRNMIKALSGK